MDMKTTRSNLSSSVTDISGACFRILYSFNHHHRLQAKRLCQLLPFRKKCPFFLNFSAKYREVCLCGPMC